jgi:hypothetical protein
VSVSGIRPTLAGADSAFGARCIADFWICRWACSVRRFRPPGTAAQLFRWAATEERGRRLKCSVCVLITLLAFITACSITSPPTNVSGTTQQCHQLFQEAIDLTVPGIDKANEKAVAFKVVEAGECFLNDCINSALPLSAQSDCLAELRQLAQVVPPSFDCAVRYAPTTQLLDLDGDSIEELVLHTQAIRCDHKARFGLHGAGGLSIVFRFSEQADSWRGTPIWPCAEDGCHWPDIWVQSPQPEVRQLVIRDTQERTFMLVSGSYYGTDHTGNILTVWRWEGDAPKPIFELEMNDWCGTPREWKITERGTILISGTEANDRCDGREAVEYVLHGDEFVMVSP